MSACCLTRDISVSAHISHPISLISSLFLKKCLCFSFGASLLAQWWWVCLPMKQMWAGSLGQEDPLEEEIATHSSVPSWRMPWTEEPGGLQSLGWQRVGYDLLTKQPQQQWIYLFGFAVSVAARGLCWVFVAGAWGLPAALGSCFFSCGMQGLSAARCRI